MQIKNLKGKKIENFFFIKNNKKNDFLKLFMQSYQEYLQFELDSKINKGLPQNPFFDFPDFPRSEFSKFLSTKAKDLDLEAYSQEFKLLNPKSNVQNNYFLINFFKFF